LVFGLDDTRITAAIRPRYIYDNRRLFRDASMVVLDASPHAETLETIFRLAGRYQVPVCADPTSVTLASRLRPYLRDLLLVAPNVQEAEVLCRCPIPPGDHGAALAAAKTLVLRGVQIAIITMAEEGLCYATSEESGSVPAVQTEVVDLTGGGDALTAAVVFALLNEIPVSEAMQLGCSAASLTIACDQTTVPNLTLELLYDHLSV
jgi:pseudouridine kinase